MAVFTLDKEHPLAKAGLRFVHVVEEVELGLKPGDVVVRVSLRSDRRYRYGVSTRANNTARRRDHDHSQGSDRHSGSLNRQAQEEERINGLLFRRAG